MKDKKNKKITNTVDTVRANINDYYDEKKDYFITNKEIDNELDKMLKEETNKLSK